MPASENRRIGQFRRWIVEKLKETIWLHYAGEERSEVAKRLGLQPELLLEAELSLERDCRRDGRTPVKLGSSNASSSRRLSSGFHVDLPIPPRVHADLIAYCDTRKIPPSTLLRSLIHWLLLRRELPAACSGKYWIYRGKREQICRRRSETTGRRATSVDTLVTAGAKQALIRRARKRGVAVSALVRGAVMELLEGRIKRLYVVTNVKEMWDDPDRYWKE